LVPESATLRGEVATVLPVGSDQFLGLQTPAGRVFVRVGKDRQHREGQRIELAVVTSRLHLFDKVSGESLRG
jgi:multiple sugar transport system ATP-binding protein